MGAVYCPRHRREGGEGRDRFLEQLFGIVHLADRAGAWEAIVRSLALGLFIGWLVTHFAHRRHSNLADRERDLAVRERQSAFGELDQAIKAPEQLRKEVETCKREQLIQTQNHHAALTLKNEEMQTRELATAALIAKGEAAMTELMDMIGLGG